ncbi:hypothetical protein F4778DRAFT_800510 [Xylariomycetidae sp. FL2044]|nr:hypothetical protein F4778DRAFT_800510 [Xylariomycetidae sp. FL2044]
MLHYDGLTREQVLERAGPPPDASRYGYNNFFEAEPPIHFFTQPPAHARAFISTRHSTQPFRTVENPARERPGTYWGASQIQVFADNIRAHFYKDCKQMRWITSYFDLYHYFDAHDIYHHGAQNLVNVINHMTHENQFILPQLLTDALPIIEEWARERLTDSTARERLISWRHWCEPNVLAIFSPADTDMDDEFYMELIRNVLKDYQAKLSRGSPIPLPAIAYHPVLAQNPSGSSGGGAGAGAGDQESLNKVVNGIVVVDGSSPPSHPASTLATSGAQNGPTAELQMKIAGLENASNIALTGGVTMNMTPNRPMNTTSAPTTQRFPSAPTFGDSQEGESSAHIGDQHNVQGTLQGYTEVQGSQPAISQAPLVGRAPFRGAGPDVRPVAPVPDPRGYVAPSGSSQGRGQGGFSHVSPARNEQVNWQNNINLPVSNQPQPYQLGSQGSYGYGHPGHIQQPYSFYNGNGSIRQLATPNTGSTAEPVAYNGWQPNVPLQDRSIGWNTNRFQPGQGRGSFGTHRSSFGSHRESFGSHDGTRLNQLRPRNASNASGLGYSGFTQDHGNRPQRPSYSSHPNAASSALITCGGQPNALVRAPSLYEPPGPSGTSNSDAIWVRKEPVPCRNAGKDFIDPRGPHYVTYEACACHSCQQKDRTLKLGLREPIMVGNVEKERITKVFSRFGNVENVRPTMKNAIFVRFADTQAAMAARDAMHDQICAEISPEPIAVYFPCGSQFWVPHEQFLQSLESANSRGSSSRRPHTGESRSFPPHPNQSMPGTGATPSRVRPAEGVMDQAFMGSIPRSGSLFTPERKGPAQAPASVITPMRGGSQHSKTLSGSEKIIRQIEDLKINVANATPTKTGLSQVSESMAQRLPTATALSDAEEEIDYGTVIRRPGKAKMTILPPDTRDEPVEQVAQSIEAQAVSYQGAAPMETRALPTQQATETGFASSHGKVPADLGFQPVAEIPPSSPRAVASTEPNRPQREQKHKKKHGQNKSQDSTSMKTTDNLSKLATETGIQPDDHASTLNKRKASRHVTDQASGQAPPEKKSVQGWKGGNPHHQHNSSGQHKFSTSNMRPRGNYKSRYGRGHGHGKGRRDNWRDHRDTGKGIEGETAFPTSAFQPTTTSSPLPKFPPASSQNLTPRDGMVHSAHGNNIKFGTQQQTTVMSTGAPGNTAQASVSLSQGGGAVAGYEPFPVYHDQMHGGVTNKSSPTNSKLNPRATAFVSSTSNSSAESSVLTAAQEPPKKAVILRHPTAVQSDETRVEKADETSKQAISTDSSKEVAKVATGKHSADPENVNKTGDAAKSKSTTKDSSGSVGVKNHQRNKSKGQQDRGSKPAQSRDTPKTQKGKGRATTAATTDKDQSAPPADQKEDDKSQAGAGNTGGEDEKKLKQLSVSPTKSSTTTLPAASTQPSKSYTESTTNTNTGHAKPWRKNKGDGKGKSQQHQQHQQKKSQPGPHQTSQQAPAPRATTPGPQGSSSSSAPAKQQAARRPTDASTIPTLKSDEFPALASTSSATPASSGAPPTTTTVQEARPPVNNPWIKVGGSRIKSGGGGSSKDNKNRETKNEQKTDPAAAGDKVTAKVGSGSKSDETERKGG